MSDLEIIDINNNEHKYEQPQVFVNEMQPVLEETKQKKSCKKRKTGKKKRNPLQGLATGMFLLLAIAGGIGTFYYRTLYFESTSEAVSRLEEYESETVRTVSNLTLQLDEKTAEAYQLGIADGRAKAEEEVRDAIKNEVKQITQEDGVISAIRNLFPENVVYNDVGGYVFAEIDSSLKQNQLHNEQFVWNENGIADYVVEGERKSLRGIDVSKFNTNVNWDRVSSDEISFIFARVGFRGYGSGEIIDDETFLDHVNGAHEAGLDVGVYFFTQAINAKEGIEEAEYVLEKIEGLPITYPVAIDVEKVNVSSARAENISVEDRTEAVIAFCERIKEAGYTPMIYGNLKCFFSMLDMKQLEEYPKWYAYYDTELYFPYEIQCWQYSEKGKVSGIAKEVDLNIWFE